MAPRQGVATEHVLHGSLGYVLGVVGPPKILRGLCRRRVGGGLSGVAWRGTGRVRARGLARGRAGHLQASREAVHQLLRNDQYREAAPDGAWSFRGWGDAPLSQGPRGSWRQHVPGTGGSGARTPRAVGAPRVRLQRAGGPGHTGQWWLGLSCPAGSDGRVCGGAGGPGVSQPAPLPRGEVMAAPPGSAFTVSLTTVAMPGPGSWMPPGQ